MKKIFYVFFFTWMGTSCFSQSTVPSGAKEMSIAEAKALQGNQEPTINGKPYSQYKSEQKAKQLIADNMDRKNAINVPLLNSTTAANKTSAEVHTKKSVENGGLNGGGLNPATEDPSAKQSPANNTPVKPEEAPKAVSESSRKAEAARKD